MRSRASWIAVALVAGIVVALLVVPTGPCGFFAEESATFLSFGPLGPGAGADTPGEAARSYADELLGGANHQLVEADGDNAYEVHHTEGQLIAWFTVQETEHGRYLVGGHGACYERLRASVDLT